MELEEGSWWRRGWIPRKAPNENIDIFVGCFQMKPFLNRDFGEKSKRYVGDPSLTPSWGSGWVTHTTLRLLPEVLVQEGLQMQAAHDDVDVLAGGGGYTLFTYRYKYKFGTESVPNSEFGTDSAPHLPVYIE